MSGRDMRDEAWALCQDLLPHSHPSPSALSVVQAHLAAAFRAGAEQMRERAAKMADAKETHFRGVSTAEETKGNDAWAIICDSKASALEEIAELVRALPVEEPRG